MGAAGSSGEINGVRVFRVHPGSPAAEAGLEVFFDIILEVNGTVMDANNQHGFGEKVKACENGVAKLTVYSCRAHNTREVVVMPRAWAGTGILGATVRYDTVDPVECNGIRVLEVFPNSPAAYAGLVPFQDYMLGTGTAIFHDIDELVEQLHSNLNQKMSLYTYNSDSETVREISIVPNNDWGGDGCMGCDIGTGLLHRIPVTRQQPGGACAVAAAAEPAPVAPSGSPSEYPAAILPQGVPPLVAAGAPARAPLSQEGVAKLQAQIQQLGQQESAQAPTMAQETPATVPVL